MLLTRNSLISRLKNLDDQESWRDFFNSYWRLIYQVALKAGLSATEAEEVVQETIITIAKNIQSFQKGRAKGSFKGWLLKTTRWRIADQFRKRRSADAVLQARSADKDRTATVERIADPAGLEAIWEIEWETNLMQAAMDKARREVEPGVYQLFDLHAVQNWPAPKVAEKLDVTIHQVYHAKYKVSELIRREVERLKSAETSGLDKLNAPSVDFRPDNAL